MSRMLRVVLICNIITAGAALLPLPEISSLHAAESSASHHANSEAAKTSKTAETSKTSEIAAEIASDLEYRAALGRADDVSILLKKGASPNAANKEGLPLLMIAAGRKDSEATNVVRALIEGGANIMIRDSNGQTALFYAARNGNKEMVEYLLKRRIDYYALDNKGDIARTLAFRAGHYDLVALMDNFVKQQTFQLNSLEQAAKNSTTQQELDKQLHDKKEQEKAILKAKAQAKEAARLKAYYDWKLEQMKKKQAEEYKIKMEELKTKISDLSYNSCSFQYWSFCRDARQTMPLSEEALAETIEIHHSTILDISKKIMEMFSVGPNYVTKIIDISQIWIYNDLNNMPSRTYRKENGVCKVEDADRRCRQISKNWEISPGKATPAPLPQKKSKAKPAANRPKQTVYPGGVQYQKTGIAARK